MKIYQEDRQNEYNKAMGLPTAQEQLDAYIKELDGIEYMGYKYYRTGAYFEVYNVAGKIVARCVNAKACQETIKAIVDNETLQEIKKIADDINKIPEATSPYKKTR